MRPIDADALKDKVLNWMPSDPCGIAEKEHPIEADIVVSLMMEIEEAPTIEQPTWIPCSERLPSEDGPYLVWAVIGFVPDHVDMPSTYQEISIAYYSSTSKMISWFGINGVEKVLAWMPLPKPWEGADDEL